MNKNIALSAIILASLVAAASNAQEPASAGFQVKPFSEITKMRGANLKGASLDAVNRKFARQRQEVQAKGYFDTPDSLPVQEMIDMMKLKPNPLMKYNVQDSGLKAAASDVGLSFPWHGLPFPAESIKGYAAIMSYNEGDVAGRPKGWTGVTALFTDPSFEACQYSMTNFHLISGGITAPKESIAYTINGKSATFDVLHHNGFMYTSQWGNRDTAETLVCVTMTFDPQKAAHFTDLARQIDASTHRDLGY